MTSNPNIKPDRMDVSEAVLSEAIRIVKERNVEHGHTHRSFSMIGELWMSYITHAFTIRNETKIYPHDVAQLMAMVKIARDVYGDSSRLDNHIDEAGYAALAAMLKPKSALVKELNIKVRELNKLNEMFPKPEVPRPQVVREEATHSRPEFPPEDKAYDRKD